VFETEPNEDALASIVFTSGTTAKPRGVELTLRSFSMFPASAKKVLPVKAGDRSLMVLPLHHIFGIASTYFLLSRGAALGVCPDFRRLFDAVQRFRATRLFLVPALADILAHKIVSRTARPDGMPGGIEWILTGGAPLPRRIYEHLQSFGIRMLEGYGLTETCSLYSLAPYDAPRVGTAGLVSPLSEVETKVSEDGELMIRGPNVMRCYHHDPEATAKVMKDGWFHTGDTGEIDAKGYVKVVGRRNRAIVLSSGKKVAPEELENLLTGLPGLLEAFVTDEGESRQITAEVYSTLPDKTVNDQIDTVNRTLPIYKRIRHVIVRKDPFPRTASGKIKV
jgi:long-chain acyl-CoA synthetase